MLLPSIEGRSIVIHVAPRSALLTRIAAGADAAAHAARFERLRSEALEDDLIGPFSRPRRHLGRAHGPGRYRNLERLA